MLSAHLPTVLAVLGTVLMAVVIFAPAPAEQTVTVSFAPPAAAAHEHPSFESWQETPSYGSAFGALRRREAEPPDTPELAERVPRWPVLVDPSALGCDAAARLELVEALGAVRAPWAAEILASALGDEPDAAVREAIAGALC